MKPYVLKSVWLKASVLGCLWASSEIVLGSFLHNLKIPFSSNLLTGIGIVLLVSAGHIWNEKGLLWRAGLICALMKTLSPSAVIFGPMICIFSEALLIELSVVVLRRTYLGWLVGGALAMSWNLIYMVLNKLLFYGMNLLDIYTAFIGQLEKQFSFKMDSLWEPVLIVLGVYLLLGMAAAGAGIYIGRNVRKQGWTPVSIKAEKIKEKYMKGRRLYFKYSVYWLFGVVVSLVLSITFAGLMPFPYSVSGYIVFITIIIFRYKQALRAMKKPGFIVGFIAITFFTSILLGYLSLNNIYEGFVIGLVMNFRATALIMGFAAIGLELKNPYVKRFFQRNISFSLAVSLESAVETLPLVIANLPDMKSLFKRPFSVLSQLVMQAQYWLERLEFKMIGRRHIILLTGSLHSGKTSCAQEIVKEMENHNIKTAGFLSPCVFENGVRVGFDLLLLSENERLPFSRLGQDNTNPAIGQYVVNKDTYLKGLSALERAMSSGADLIFIDEIGPWELENQGWTPAINKLMKVPDLPMLWIVRQEVVDYALQYWSPASPLIINCNQKPLQEIITDVSDYIKTGYNKRA